MYPRRIKEGLSTTEIADLINKSPRTISFEIKRHLRLKKNNRADFMMVHKETCIKHLKYPYVCDCCPKKGSCLADFYEYSARAADLNYHHVLIESRKGINLTTDELNLINDVIDSGVKLGQSIEHIVATHEELPVGIRSIYRYIDAGSLAIKKYQLRHMKLKKRVVTTTPKKESYYYDHRRFIDYFEYCYKHPGIYTTQVDTVIGKRTDHKMIMTLIVIELHFFYAVVVDRSAEDVVDGIDYIYHLIGHDLFIKLFPVILTDRGNEFSLPDKIEFNAHGEFKTKLFYCDPMASYQKGAIESIHRLLRYVSPKGQSLDFLEQHQLDKFISSINNYKLRSNDFHTSYQLVQRIFGKDLLNNLKVRELDPDSIHLTPQLVK